MKNMYYAPELEYVMLSTSDVIATSMIEIGADNDADGKFGIIRPIRNRE